jgi:hypothetical protein
LRDYWKTSKLKIKHKRQEKKNSKLKRKSSSMSSLSSIAFNKQSFCIVGKSDYSLYYQKEKRKESLSHQRKALI